MPVFRAYRRIIKKNLSQLLIYLAVFIGLAASLLSSGAATPADTVFSDAKVKLAFVDEADSSILTEGLKAYLERYANMVDVKHDRTSLQDALFFEDVDYILRIPSGFTEDFMAGRPIELEKTSRPASFSSVYLDMNINKFLNTARFYLANIPGISQQELVAQVIDDLSVETAVEIRSKVEDINVGDNITSFFNYMSYVLLSLLILGIGTFMMVFNQKDLRSRTLCSSVPLRQQNMQILWGNLIYAVVCWMVMMILGFVMYGRTMLAKPVMLMALNAFVFTLVALSISFMVGSTLNSRNALSAVTNVVSLGMCFTCGVFVPQFMLGEKVLAFAQIFPVYWYVRFNNEIINLGSIALETFKPFLGYMGMQLGIGVAILAVALVIIKQKRQTWEA
ncbi:ABC transporter permease [Thermoclostridium caenicola]|uniref:ABC-2 type transport system permease protein n=1 Tax=Thermoclostridium caenicola TaxID=659425 RepID=A0A1M6DEJ5_9FIRM|nr:ABC transporter permease [Thermoclostridium caenicola]SHI71633.1 ABC-2 type transport system permease protein [Thermoclostridium caenicola]